MEVGSGGGRVCGAVFCVGMSGFEIGCYGITVWWHVEGGEMLKEIDGRCGEKDKISL